MQIFKLFWQVEYQTVPLIILRPWTNTTAFDYQPSSFKSTDSRRLHYVFSAILGSAITHFMVNPAKSLLLGAAIEAWSTFCRLQVDYTQAA